MSHRRNAMRDDIFQHMIELDQCPDNIQRMVLQLPEGTLSAEEVERALEHIAHCDSCRYMLEFYGEFLEYMKNEAGQEDLEKKPWLEIPIVFAAAGMTALQGDYLRSSGKVHVLSDNMKPSASRPSNALEFNVPFGPERTALIRITKAGDWLSIEIAADRPGARYYLISGNDFRIVSPVRGHVTFDGVPPGTMVVSEEMRRFVKLSIKTGNGI